MNKSESINDLAAALAKAQKQIGTAAADSSNPFFHSKYADLASVWDAIRGPLSVNGLAVLQPVESEGIVVTITTILVHESGQWVSADLKLSGMKQVQGGGWQESNNPQAIGSAITYGRRYALAAMVGVAPEDDDAEMAEGRGGNAAEGNKQPTKPQRQRPRDGATGAMPKPAPPGKISEDQQKHIFEVAHKAGKTQEQVKAIVNAYGFATRSDIAVEKYEEICDQILKAEVK